MSPPSRNPSSSGGRGQPAPLHDPSQQPEQQHGDQIEDVGGGLIGGQEHHHRHQRRQDVDPHRRDLGKLVGEAQRDDRGHDVGDGRAPHDGVGESQVLVQHVRARLQAVDHEGADQERHGRAAGDAEGQRGHQRAALLGVVGALGSDDAAHVAGSEGEGSVLAGGFGVSVGEPVHHRRTQARNDADPGSQKGAAEHQPPVGEHVPDAVSHPFHGLLGHAADLLALDHHVGELGQREDSQAHHDDVETVEQVERIEGPPQQPFLLVDADHGNQQSHAPGNDALEGHPAAEDGHHGDAHDAQGEELWCREQQHQRFQDGNEQAENDGADDAAQQGGHIGGAEGASRLTLPGHGVSVQDRRL